MSLDRLGRFESRPRLSGCEGGSRPSMPRAVSLLRCRRRFADSGCGTVRGSRIVPGGQELSLSPPPQWSIEESVLGETRRDIQPMIPPPASCSVSISYDLSRQSTPGDDRNHGSDQAGRDEGDGWPFRRGPEECGDPRSDEPRHLECDQADADPDPPSGDEVGTVRSTDGCHSNISKNGGNVPMTPRMPSPRPM